MRKTAVFFSPRGGSVEKVAMQLGSMLGTDKAAVVHVKSLGVESLDAHEQLILVGSTVGADHWDNEVIEDEWIEFFDKLSGRSFANKKVALVGLGNCVLYPEHFADGLAVLYENVLKLHGEISGRVDSNEYDFTDSEAVDEDGNFCGLALDEDNESELTPERLERWILLLKSDFDFSE